MATRKLSAVSTSLWQKLEVRTARSIQCLTYHPCPTEYIDLFLIHNPNSGKQLRLETYKALLESRDAGKIRDVGVSN